MFVKGVFFASHPLFSAYFQSDSLGKGIFLLLFVLSILTWSLCVYKFFLTKRLKKRSMHFQEIFLQERGHPLSVEWVLAPKELTQNPFYHLYMVLRKQTRELLQKNHHFSKKAGLEHDAMLNPDDIAYVESHLVNTVQWHTRRLEKNLFLLSTVVTLAPFLGLLGTVWGIFCTFSAMQGGSMASQGSQAILSGLSLALATTIFGLIDAIPALIGYNYLRNAIGSFGKEMEHFSHEVLSAVELQYRRVDL